MTPGLISFFIGLGIGTFSYVKLVRKTGSTNSKQDLIVAAIIGGLVFIVLYTFLKFIIHLE